MSWKVPETQGERDLLCERHNREAITFEADGHEIHWGQWLWFEDAEDSKDGRAHVCYKSTVLVDGVKKDIRAIKTAMRHLARNSADAMRKTAQLVQDGVYEVSA